MLFFKIAKKVTNDVYDSKTIEQYLKDFEK